VDNVIYCFVANVTDFPAVKELWPLGNITICSDHYVWPLGRSWPPVLINTPLLLFCKSNHHLFAIRTHIRPFTSSSREASQNYYQLEVETKTIQKVWHCKGNAMQQAGRKM